MSLADFINSQMKSKKLSSYKISFRSGGEISPSYIDQLRFNKMKNPTADKLVYLANGLGCSIYDVLESIGTITKSDAAKWAADFMVEDPQMIEILAIFQAVPADKREMLIETLRLMSKGLSE